MYTVIIIQLLHIVDLVHSLGSTYMLASYSLWLISAHMHPYYMGYCFAWLLAKVAAADPFIILPYPCMGGEVFVVQPHVLCAESCIRFPLISLMHADAWASMGWPCLLNLLPYKKESKCRPNRFMSMSQSFQEKVKKNSREYICFMVCWIQKSKVLACVMHSSH